MKVTILGCGASNGVPVIGCPCAVCQSPEPKNRRTRSSLLVELPEGNLLVDTAPDLRFQALREGLTKVDAVLFTHSHADHTHGIDELRSFNHLSGKPIPLYGVAETVAELKLKFPYSISAGANMQSGLLPTLTTHEIDYFKPFPLLGAVILPFLQLHGKGKSTGYRIGNFAYSPDVDNLEEGSLQVLEGLDVWLVDCLRYTPAPTHAHLAKTLEWIARVKPKRAILTHMAHDFDYETLKAELPQGVEPAYDGMVIQMNLHETVM